MAKVINVEKIRVNDEDYNKVYFDVGDNTFSTVHTAQINISVDTYVRNTYGSTGLTEKIPGHKDGNVSYKSPIRIGGIEILDSTRVIGFDPLVVGESIDENTFRYSYYSCMDSEYQGTSVDEHYKLVGYIDIDSNDFGTLQLIRHYNIRSDGLMFPDLYRNIIINGKERPIQETVYRYFLKGIIHLDNTKVGTFAQCYYGSMGDNEKANLTSRIRLMVPNGNATAGHPRLGGCGKKRGVWNGFKKSVA